MRRWLALALFGCNDLLGQHAGRNDAHSSFTIDVPFVWVPANGKVDVPFTIARNGVSGTLLVHAATLPPGVTAADATVSAGESSGTIVLSAPGATVVGIRSDAVFDLVDDARTDDEKTITAGVSGTSGSLDTTWGSNGEVKLALANPSAGYVADIDGNGLLVVGGVVTRSTTDIRLVLARFQTDGSLDTSFGDPSGDARLGYAIYNPGFNDTKWATEPTGIRVDSKGRIAMVNNRGNGLCVAEAGRWTADGDVDKTFRRYSQTVTGTNYCGSTAGVDVTASDDVVMLAYWNVDAGMESLVQILAESDGTPTSTFHVALDPSGTKSAQKFTVMQGIHVDKRGGFVLAGRQCSGTMWGQTITSEVPVIARIDANGRDSNFGSSPGFTSFSFGSGLESGFWGLALDPATGDAIAVGQNDNATQAVVARVSGTTGLPVGFESRTLGLMAGATSQALLKVAIDSRNRIVATGNTNASKTFIARVRMKPDGTLDESYASAGIGLQPGLVRATVLGKDDRLYIVGDSGSDITIWRYWP